MVQHAVKETCTVDTDSIEVSATPESVEANLGGSSITTSPSITTPRSPHSSPKTTRHSVLTKDAITGTDNWRREHGRRSCSTQAARKKYKNKAKEASGAGAVATAAAAQRASRGRPEERTHEEEWLALALGQRAGARRRRHAPIALGPHTILPRHTVNRRPRRSHEPVPMPMPPPVPPAKYQPICEQHTPTDEHPVTRAFKRRSLQALLQQQSTTTTSLTSNTGSISSPATAPSPFLHSPASVGYHPLTSTTTESTAQDNSTTSKTNSPSTATPAIATSSSEWQTQSMTSESTLSGYFRPSPRCTSQTHTTPVTTPSNAGDSSPVASDSSAFPLPSPAIQPLQGLSSQEEVVQRSFNVRHLPSPKLLRLAAEGRLSPRRASPARVNNQSSTSVRVLWRCAVCRRQAAVDAGRLRWPLASPAPFMPGDDPWQLCPSCPSFAVAAMASPDQSFVTPMAITAASPAARHSAPALRRRYSASDVMNNRRRGGRFTNVVRMLCCFFRPEPDGKEPRCGRRVNECAPVSEERKMSTKSIM